MQACAKIREVAVRNKNDRVKTFDSGFFTSFPPNASSEINQCLRFKDLNKDLHNSLQNIPRLKPFKKPRLPSNSSTKQASALPFPLSPGPNCSLHCSPPTGHLFVLAQEAGRAGHKGKQPPHISQEKSLGKSLGLPYFEHPKLAKLAKTREPSRKKARKERTCGSGKGGICTQVKTGA